MSKLEIGTWVLNERKKFVNSDTAAIDENGNPFIKKKLVTVKHYKCSVCEEISDYNSPYCPECGAKMERTFTLEQLKMGDHITFINGLQAVVDED